MLVISLAAQAFGLRLLDPYFENIAPDFRQGINFATSTSRVRPLNLGAAPFYLNLQVNQAIRFYNRSLHAPSKALGTNHCLLCSYVLSCDVGVIKFQRAAQEHGMLHKI